MTKPSSRWLRLDLADFLLEDAIDRSHDDRLIKSRALLQHPELAEKIAIHHAENQGAFLHQLLRDFSRSSPDWAALGRSHHFSTQQVGAVILAVASCDIEVARSFCKILEDDVSKSRETAFLKRIEPIVLAAGIHQSWLANDYDAQALALLIETFGHYIPAGLFEKMLRSHPLEISGSSNIPLEISRLRMLPPTRSRPLRTESRPQRPPEPQRVYPTTREDLKNDRLLEFDNVLDLLTRSHLDEDKIQIVKNVRSTLAAFSSDPDSFQRRSKLIRQTNELANFPEQGSSPSEELASFLGRCKAISQFNLNKAVALCITGFTTRATEGAEISAECERRLDNQFQRLIQWQEDNPFATVPRDIKRVVSRELLRRAHSALVETSDGLRLLENRLDETERVAQEIGIKPAELRIQSIRGQLKEQVEQYQRQKAATALLGFGPEILPSNVKLIGVTFSPAYIEYPDVDRLISDVEPYLSTEDCEDIRRDLKWNTPSDDETRHYKIHDSDCGMQAFGNLIFVVFDQGKLRLDIQATYIGPGAMRIARGGLSEGLIQFAESLEKKGINRRIVCDESPTLSFVVIPDAEILQDIATLTKEKRNGRSDAKVTFDEASVFSRGLSVYRTLLAPLSHIATSAGRIVGRQLALPQPQEDVLNETNRELRNERGPAELGFVIGSDPLIGSDEQVFVTYRYSYDSPRMQLQPGGFAQLAVSFNNSRVEGVLPGLGSITGGLPQLDIRIDPKRDGSGVSTTEQNFRARAFLDLSRGGLRRSLLGSFEKPLAVELSAGWWLRNERLEFYPARSPAIEKQSTLTTPPSPSTAAITDGYGGFPTLD